MKPKRHYIPIVPDKPKQGPKITRLFSWKKHKVEKPTVEVEHRSKVWKVLKYVLLAYGILAAAVGVIIYISISNIPETDYDDDFAYNYWKSVTNRINQDTKEPTDSDDEGTTQNNGGSGYCSSNSDCVAFGSRNGGPAICGRDRLCHICYSLRGETCISCSMGCDVNTYCEQGYCVFNLGGRTTD